ncbi:polysaccharide export outer membrane protein [Silvibacterium bohemicum]|uniref:Polysaccharide export outer membrane protein n=1 Tax=Silvibacterium bohemicum TaxID=1577686 RepID=A0A841JWG0_9BACT|nr:polysaccharide biosynthesis/export family protein [Silvibacterium bohemicum]MBB6144895.1 polysaccharide export outer membrane protein [Silvibacterium bohemicum]
MTRLLLAAILLVSSLQAQAQSDSKIQESLRIAPGDLLHIIVLREPDLERRVRVCDSGEISLPLIGAIEVRGLNVPEAAAEISRRYLDGQFLRHPDVSVSLEEFTTQQVSVLGQVVKPGTFSIPAPRSLIDMLAMAGGFTDIADRHLTIERADRSQAAEVFVSNRADDALEANVLIYPGDKILVPKAGIVYVLGDVGRPGGYVMQNESRMTVLQAIAMATGTNRTASESHVRLLRNKDGEIEEQQIPLKEIERGAVPDPLLEANDVLYVPFNFGKHIVMGSGSIMASASSALIYAGH